jgi:uncharacterized cupredoxin-like copper-binding protein
MKPLKQIKHVALFTLLLVTANLSFSQAHTHSHTAHTTHATAFGKPGKAEQVSRTITVTMKDSMRFTPSNITVKRGETVKFIVKNEGKLKHEMVLGTAKDLKEHAEMMRQSPDMQHDDPNQVSLDAGQTGELIWQFNRAGKVDFACLQAGHFEAGMVGNIKVVRNF